MNLPLVLLVFSSFFVGAEALVNLRLGRGEKNLFVEAMIGSPGQPIKLILVPESTYDSSNPTYDPVIPSERCSSGGFNTLKTSSFHQIRASKFGTDGTDVISLGNGQVFEPTGSLTLFDSGCVEHGEPGTGHLHLGNKYKQTLIQTHLAKQREQVAVISYKGMTSRVNSTRGGTLTLGGRPSKLCKNDWTYVPQVTDDNFLWFFELDKVSYGGQTNTSPGRVFIDAGNVAVSYYTMNEPFCSSILDYLKAQQNTVNNGYYVACDTKEIITFSVNGIQFQLGPDDYIDYGARSWDQRCGLRFNCAYGFSTLPASAMRGRCLLYDYANKRMGFATRIKS